MTSSSSRSRRQSIAMGLFIIAASIFIGIYAVLGGAGNRPSDNSNAQLAQGTCEVDKSNKAALAALAKGPLENFEVADENLDFSFLKFKNEAGEEIGLSAFSGKAVFVNLWATWCAPCRHEMPAINQIALEYGDENLEIVALSLDQASPAKSIAFLDEIGASSLAFYGEGSGAAFKALSQRKLLRGLPTSYLINSSGCLVGSLAGAADWASDESKAILNFLIGL